MAQNPDKFILNPVKELIIANWDDKYSLHKEYSIEGKYIYYRQQSSTPHVSIYDLLWSVDTRYDRISLDIYTF